jgi:hypothetical protein
VRVKPPEPLCQGVHQERRDVAEPPPLTRTWPAGPRSSRLGPLPRPSLDREGNEAGRGLS